MLAMILGFSEISQLQIWPYKVSEVIFTWSVGLLVRVHTVPGAEGAMFVPRLPHPDCSDTAGSGVSLLTSAPPELSLDRRSRQARLDWSEDKKFWILMRC